VVEYNQGRGFKVCADSGETEGPDQIPQIKKGNPLVNPVDFFRPGKVYIITAKG